MSSLVVPFLNSFTRSTEYPCNLLDKQTYSATLTAYRTRLNESAEKLCASSESEASVPFRDFDENTKSMCNSDIAKPTNLLQGLKKPTILLVLMN
jgi:hypothetical protein